MMRRSAWIISLLLLVSACGGGGSNTDSPSPSPGGGNAKPNVAPVANAGNDQVVDENTEVDLIGTGSDTDGSIASYSWTQIAGTAVTLTATNTSTAAFTAPEISTNETLTFQLSVTDNQGATHSDSVNVSIVAIDLVTVVTNASAGTVMYPVKISTKRGEKVSFRVALETGYENIVVSGCGGELVGEIYTVAAIESDCSVASQASLTNAVYSVSYSPPDGFTVEPVSTTFSVKAGEKLSLKFFSAGSHRISGIQGNGGTWNGSEYESAPIVKNTHLLFLSEEIGSAFKVWNTSVTPNAVWHEDRASTPVCFEADVTGNFSSIVMSPKWDDQANRPMRVPMFDDGTHCDKTADDGVYSAEYTYPDEYPYQLNYAGNTVGGNFMQFFGIDAQDNLLYNQSEALSQSNGTNVYFIPKKYAVEATLLSSNNQMTEHVWFIEQSDITKDAVYPELVRAKADLMFGKNRFDFQVNYQIGGQFAGVYPVQSFHPNRSDAFGIGRNGIVKSEDAAGRLLGHLFMSTGIGTVYSLSHEFLHAWVNYLNNPSLNLQFLQHNIECNSIGGIVGTTFVYEKNTSGDFVRKGVTTSYAGPASELELYLAGLLPFENLSSEMFFYQGATDNCLAWGNTPIPASEFLRVEPQDIANVYGERSVPDREHSRKDFSTLFVAVSHRMITEAEMAVIERVAKYYESSDPNYASQTFPPFYWMAQQLGTMSTTITAL
ncbi:MAG: hypothetical protein GW763_00410 [Paraglaciecola sp.]|nr:hypothetical protein [Paraglaciecola sp.]NCT46455.1 hypothetical protein [Paraglaciecola sp.]